MKWCDSEDDQAKGINERHYEVNGVDCVFFIGLQSPQSMIICPIEAEVPPSMTMIGSPHFLLRWPVRISTAVWRLTPKILSKRQVYRNQGA